MRCDAARVGAIFRYLITNALKYNDKPQKWIAIGCVGPGRVGRSSRKLPSATAGASGWNPRLAEGSHFIGHWMPTMTSRHQPIPLVEDSPENYEATAPAFRRAGLANPLLHCADGDSALDLLYQRETYGAPTEAPRPGVILPDLNLPGTEGGTCSRS
jgi:hypothetical protein